MLVSDVMTAKVVTVAGSTPLAEIRRLMDEKRIKRVPVVERGRLVGLVTRNTLDREMSSLISTLTAADVMARHLVTVPPEATVEEAVGTAQVKRVGALLVVRRGRLVGIATTNDFFYKILNPLLGIELPGARIAVEDCSTAEEIEKVLHAVNELKAEVTSMFAMQGPGSKSLKLTMHLATEDAGPLVAALRKRGYKVESRKR